MKFSPKLIGIFASTVLLSANVAAQQFKTYEDSLSYVIGLNIGNDISKTGIKFNIDNLAQGMKDVGKAQLLIPEAQQQGIMMRFQQSMQAKQQAEQAKAQAEKAGAAQKNLAASNAFLAENKKKAGVTTTASGLQYEIVKKGPDGGKHPALTDEVTVHYEGKLINGKIFDSSYQRNAPATFMLNGLIQAWQEGIQLMSPGDVFMLYVPPAMGYGEGGAGENIGPNEVLIFKVELISIK